MSGSINKCNLCNAVNSFEFKLASDYTVCYYCYCATNSKEIDHAGIIENQEFEKIAKDLNIDFANTNSILVAYKDNILQNIKICNLNDKIHTNSFNRFLKDGRVDNIFFPNIEKFFLPDILSSSINVIKHSGNIYIGFYTNVYYLMKMNLIHNIKYIYNIYFISKILDSNFQNYYINDYFINNNYILIKINTIKNIKKEKDLQNLFDQLFFANFKKQIKYAI